MTPAPTTGTTPGTGTFDTVRYRFSPEGLEPEEVWVLPDDNTLVRASWPHYDTTYELVAYDVMRTAAE